MNSRFFVLPFLFFQTFVWAGPPDEAARKPVEKLIESFLQGDQAAGYPKAWTERLQTRELNINELTRSNFESGRAYGAVAFQRLAIHFADIRKATSQAGFALKLVNNVKTMRDTEKIDCSVPSENEACIKTAIKVPVVSDFHTRVKLLRSESFSRVVLEWKQIDDQGELSYNQGAMILEPNGEKSKITVIGTHIIKLANKVPWIGRGTATSFAKRHYGNFVDALIKTISGLEQPSIVTK